VIGAATLLLAALITVNIGSDQRSSAPTPAPRVVPTRPPFAQPHQGLPAPSPHTQQPAPPSLVFPGIPFPPTTVAPNPPTGVPAKIGQQVADGQLTFMVASFDRSKTVASPINPFLQVTADGIFVNVHVTITNTGAEPVLLFATDQKLRVGNVVYNVDAVAALSTLTAAIPLGPGASVPVTLSFDVPADTSPSVVELHTSSMSRGVDVTLQPN
jgi:hypothetical protein